MSISDIKIFIKHQFFFFLYEFLISSWSFCKRPPSIVSPCGRLREIIIVSDQLSTGQRWVDQHGRVFFNLRSLSVSIQFFFHIFLYFRIICVQFYARGASFYSFVYSFIYFILFLLPLYLPFFCRLYRRQLLYCCPPRIAPLILLHEKFLQFDWLRAVVFQLNLKYLHVKITNLLRVVV